MSDHIPFELQVEIMKRLPVKSLIQFRSVSKPWKSVIDSPNFSHHAQPQHHHLLIRYKTPSSELTYVSIVDDDDDDDDTFPQINYSLFVPPSINLLTYSYLVGTTHGLLCLFGYYGNADGTETKTFVVWNPSIRKSVAIAVPYVDRIKKATFGFGVCRATNDPKIVTCSNSSGSWQVEVFSLSSRVWRNSFGSLPATLIELGWCRSQVNVDGFIYWIGLERLNACVADPLVVSFDLSSEEFEAIHFPDSFIFYSSTFWLCKRSDSLAVIRQNLISMNHEVWIMENGVSKSFVKLFTINMGYDLENVISLSPEFRRNGKLMMAIPDDTSDLSELVVYEPLSEHINRLGIKGQYVSFLVSSYTESLLLLNQ